MKISIEGREPINDEKENNVINNNKGGGPYVSLKDAMQSIDKDMRTIVQKSKTKYAPSKALVIENVTVLIIEDLKGNFTFKVGSIFAQLPDGTVPEFDISVKSEICFDEDITLEKFKGIIRRCGILEKYKDLLTNDPEIIINSYTLQIMKEYQFFDEFKEGVLIAEDIFE